MILENLACWFVYAELVSAYLKKYFLFFKCQEGSILVQWTALGSLRTSLEICIFWFGYAKVYVGMSGKMKLSKQWHKLS